MSEATLIYPHQLFSDSPALSKGRAVFLVEESLILTHNPIHRQKLIFHKLSLDAYEQELTDAGYDVTRLTLSQCAKTAQVFAALKKQGITKLHIVDTTDNYLERAIAASGVQRVWYESPLFILSKDEATKRFLASKRQLARFYKKLRQDKNILIDADGAPTGGKWSYDADNRRKLPKKIELPADIKMFGSEETVAATKWAENVEAEQYGEPGCWLPFTRTEAEKFLQEFLRLRFTDFGPYEDAITASHTRLFHSTLSPLINVGLLTPQQVLDAALAFAQENADIPLNSLEGFVRQILGWREFMRASYECDGCTMRQQNFFQHSHPLPPEFWAGNTGIIPVDHAIKNALEYGYTHHIERLMVLGNFMLLNQLHPDEVYRWFMGMYLDAYDWVMVPNVYGMSQFADGGSFATKPYISGSNYIKKMSDFPAGDWETTWTGLYWHFIATHKEFFSNNHRLSMMPRLLDKMSAATRTGHLQTAAAFFKATFPDSPTPPPLR